MNGSDNHRWARLSTLREFFDWKASIAQQVYLKLSNTFRNLFAGPAGRISWVQMQTYINYSSPGFLSSLKRVSDPIDSDLCSSLSNRPTFLVVIKGLVKRFILSFDLLLLVFENEELVQKTCESHDVIDAWRSLPKTSNEKYSLA